MSVIRVFVSGMLSTIVPYGCAAKLPLMQPAVEPSAEVQAQIQNDAAGEIIQRAHAFLANKELRRLMPRKC